MFGQYWSCLAMFGQYWSCLASIDQSGPVLISLGQSVSGQSGPVCVWSVLSVSGQSVSGQSCQCLVSLGSVWLSLGSDWLRTRPDWSLACLRYSNVNRSCVPSKVSQAMSDWYILFIINYPAGSPWASLMGHI